MGAPRDRMTTWGLETACPGLAHRCEPSAPFVRHERSVTPSRLWETRRRWCRVHGVPIATIPTPTVRTRRPPVNRRIGFGLSPALTFCSDRLSQENVFGKLPLPRSRRTKYFPGAAGLCPSSLFETGLPEHMMASSALTPRPRRTGLPRRAPASVLGPTAGRGARPRPDAPGIRGHASRTRPGT